MKKIYLSAIILLCLTFSQAMAGYYSEVDEVLPGNFGGFGARQMAMGGAGIMSIDGAALFYNPANLARIPRIEFNMGLTFQKYKDLSRSHPIGSATEFEINDSKTNSRLNSFILSIPYPTYRGSLVFGIGMARTADFDRVSTIYYEENSYYTPEEIIENGGINQWGFGFGIDLSPRISFGSSIFLYHGKHDLNLESNLYTGGTLIEEWRQLLEYKYTGFGARLGLSMYISPRLAVGLAAELPVSYNVEQEATLLIDNEEFYDFAEYDLKKPFVFSAGLSLRYKYLTFLADIEYVDWTQLAYGDNYIMEANYNNDIRYFYRDVIRMRFGGEYNFPELGVSLRGGYFIDPLPYLKEFIHKDRKGFTLGIGLLIDQVMTLDVAYVHSSQTNYTLLQPADGSIFNDNFELFEETSINRIYITGAYRF